MQVGWRPLLIRLEASANSANYVGGDCKLGWRRLLFAIQVGGHRPLETKLEKGSELQVSITQRGSAMPAELAPLLCRVLAQHAVQHAAQRAQRAPWWVQLEGDVGKKQGRVGVATKYHAEL